MTQSGHLKRDAQSRSQGHLPFDHGKPSIESIKLAELLEFRARCSKAVYPMIAIAIADRHPAKEHLLRGQLQKIADQLVKAYPGHLRTGIEPVAARQEG